MISVVYRNTQKEKLLDALQARFKRSEKAIEFLLTKSNSIDEFNEQWEVLKKEIKENKELARILIDKKE